MSTLAPRNSQAGLASLRAGVPFVTPHTRPTLSRAAVAALSVLLDVNDDDEIMLDAGVDAAGLAELRALVRS